MNTIIHTPCPDLQTSLDFYKRLNFEVISASEPTLVSDGQAMIEINPERFARAGVKLYQKDWKDVVTKLEMEVNITPIQNGHLLSDPSGVWVYLLNDEAYNTVDAGVSKSILGTFAGISLETTDMARSLMIWTTLGFKSSGSADQSWVSCTAENGMVVSLMKPMSCPHLFFNPSLTYFNGGNNLEVIENIRKAGIPIAEGITHFNKEGIVDNVILRDPGGYGFFVFND
ncbi:MAG: hypothetical protein AAFN93_04675 [Bacteroidota bacterium]